MKNWIELVLKYPRTVIVFTILLTILLGWNIPNLVIEPDVKAMLPEDMPIIVSVNKLDEIFGGSELVILALESEDIFSENTLHKIEEITAEVEEYPLVERVISLTNAVDIQGTDFGFEVQDVIEGYSLSESEKESIKERLLDNPLLRGNIVSDDFRYTALVAILSFPNDEIRDKDTFAFFTELKNRYAGPEEIYAAGMPLTREEVSVTMQSDMKKLFPFGVILMIFLLVFSFRSWLGAFLPFAVVIMSIVDTLGLMAILGIKLTIIGVIMPVMLIAIANDYSIHIVAFYYEEVNHRQSLSKTDILRKTISHLKSPVFLAGITTIVGFMSLQSHILPPARQLGLMTSFGIMMAFVMSLTFVPAAMRILRYPPVLEQKINRRTNRVLTGWGHFFIRYKKSFLAVSLALIAFFAVRIPAIVVDTNPIHYWHENSEIRTSNEIIDRNFGGSSQLAILAEGDIKSPAFLEKIESLTDYLSQDSIVTQTVSIVDQVRQMNQAFHGDSAAYDAIPESRDIVAQYLFLYSITGDPGDLDHLVDYEYRQAQAMARVNSNSSSDLYRLFKNAEQYISERLSSAEFPNITGMVAIIGELADLIVLGQVRSLIISIVLVAILSGLIFRSAIMGLLSIVPLSGAVVFVFGLMGYSGISLNIATAMLSSIMIGVGIDYTIHFLYRFRAEVQGGMNSSEAVIRTLVTTGKGIIYNALSVIVGFTVLLLSGFEPIFFFGFLIVFSITACLFGALAIMPALLVWIRAERFFQKENQHEG